MGWVTPLHGSLVAIDSAPFIYYIETNPNYIAAVDELFNALANGKITAIVSTLTLTELLSHPIKTGNHALVQAYRAILNDTDRLSLIPVTSDIAEKAAELRAKYNLRTPDAIHIATAIEAGATTFITNDKQLRRVTEISVLTLDALK